MKPLILFLFAFPLLALTCPSGTTHIQGVWTIADGSPAYGKILAKGPSSPLGSALPSTVTFTFGAGGAYEFCLAGGVAQKYAATYLLTTSTGRATSSYTETWIVPATSSTLTIPQLWGGSSAPQFLVSWDQMNPAGYGIGQGPIWSGLSWAPGAAAVPQVAADWNAAVGVAAILNKPSLPGFQVNGVSLANSSTINFVNPASYSGLTFTFSNPSAGGVTFAVGGAVNSLARGVAFQTSNLFGPSFNIPWGAAVTSPVSGDFWNIAGVLKFHDGAATRSILTDASTLAWANITGAPPLAVTNAGNTFSGNNTFLGNVAVGTMVLVAASTCDGVTDSRLALQAILTANAGGNIVLPDGATCLITPVPDKTKFLTLTAGTRLSGRATLKVANGSAPYDVVLYAADCTGCSISDILIDANVAGNPLVNQAAIFAHPRIEMNLNGNDVSVMRVSITNSSSINCIIVNGLRVRVEDSTFTVIGDDPNHVVHDHSTIYMTATQGSVARNHFTAAVRGSPGGYSAIEIHGSGIAVTANTIQNYVNGLNLTGVAIADSIGNTATANTISGALYGITLWSSTYSTHTTGYGINGLVITANNISINQLSYAGLTLWGSSTNTAGIFIDPTANLPVKNVSIIGNTITFDPEPGTRTANSASFAIGWYSVSNQTAENILIEDNVIDYSPAAAIRLSTGGVSGLKISGNVIRNAGQSLDGAVQQAYKTPIFIATSGGATYGVISGNTIRDNQAASRMANAFYLAGANVANDLRILDNTVSLTGATTTSWLTYFSQADDFLVPFVRMAAAGKAWTTPLKAMRNGSSVYDTTTGIAYNLPVDGVAWSAGIGVPALVAKVDLAGQVANVGSTTFYTVPAGSPGMYRFHCYPVVTLAATSTSALPNCYATWIDADTNITKSLAVTGAPTTNAVGTNGLAAAVYWGFTVINCKAGSVVQYSTAGYGTAGATAMAYAMHVKLEYLGQ